LRLGFPTPIGPDVEARDLGFSERLQIAHAALAH
jgi:hypothetical protein